MELSLPKKIAVTVVLVTMIQLLYVKICMSHLSRSSLFNDNGSASSHSMPLAAKNTTQSVGEQTIKMDNSCFPPRHNNKENHTITTIYLETAHVNLHYETYYSFINHLCSCELNKDPYWTISSDTVPHFYVGPDYFLTPGFERILQEYNDTTSCGPIFLGEPPTNTKRDLTIVTTSYPSHFDPSPGNKNQYQTLLNDPRYIFICHEDAPSLEGENATNVFFLTPRHKRYIVPSFFPPSIVERLTSESKQQQGQHQKKRQPIFLVLGSFNSNYRRSVGSLASAVRYHQQRNFTVRFLGGASQPGITNEQLEQNLRKKFPEGYSKVELLVRTDSDEFMQRVAESDVILPLVEQAQFYRYNNGYQEGKKLTSSVMWGLGFHKKMILYRPLAEVFGIEEDNVTYFLHGDPTIRLAAFNEAFGRVLDYYESSLGFDE